MVLTTHYLEEAQSLCKRIAMLKAGRVVALDTTEALVKRISGSQLTVRLASGSLPDSLRPLLSQADDLAANNQLYTLRVNDYAEIEPILSRLREAGAVLDDLQLQQADLEDVFIQIMGGAK